MTRKTTDIVQVKLRVPEWLRREVLRAADKSGRSLNGELVHLIQEGLAKPKNAALIKEAVEKSSAETLSLMGTLTEPMYARVIEALKATFRLPIQKSDLERFQQVRAYLQGDERTHDRPEANRPPTYGDMPSLRREEDESDDRPHPPPR
jgi:hypothetical protein